MPSVASDLERFQTDFEYWCEKCVRIQDKLTGERIPFVLNRPQKKLLAVMEQQRREGKPIRIILLKSRQWGGSTLVQIYIAWFQLVLKKGKNSVIVGHKRIASSTIKFMLKSMLAYYPEKYLENPDEPYKLVNVPEAKDVQELVGRDCFITISSSYSTDSVRSQNLAFAHLSEVAFWTESRNADPADILRSINGTIPLARDTIIVLESTANGSNSFFYKEWMRAVEGKSVFTPVFVGWTEIDMYAKPLDDNYNESEFSEYEKALLEKGIPKPKVYWYHEKVKEFPEHELLKAEFPTTAEEAFVTSTHYIFTAYEQTIISQNAALPTEVDDDLMIWLPHRRFDNEFRFNYFAVLTLGINHGASTEFILSVWQINRSGDHPAIELAAQLQSNLPMIVISQKVLAACHRYSDPMLIVVNNNIDANELNRSQAMFVIDDEMMRYRNLYRTPTGPMLDIDKFLYSLMFYELIYAEKNQSLVDHHREACETIAGMVIHRNQRFYVGRDKDFNFVLNRAEALYALKALSVKNTRNFSLDDMLGKRVSNFL